MPTTITVSTQSHRVNFPVTQFVDPDDPSRLPPAPPASVQINGQDIGGLQAIAPSRFHLVVFDPAQPLTSPSAILFNRSLWNPTNNWEHDLWWGTNDQFYDFIHNQILAAGNPDELLFLIASSGFDLGMVPSPSFATFLFGCGAGQPLQNWIKAVPGGSGASPAQMWVQNPVNYIFMGGTGLGFGQAYGEKFEPAAAGQTSLTTTLTINL